MPYCLSRGRWRVKRRLRTQTNVRKLATRQSTSGHRRAVEHELGETIKVVLRLQNHESANVVVATLREVFKKIQLVWTAVLVAKNADGSETTEDWKRKARDTMTAISKCNDKRAFVAHSLLEPQTDGSLVLNRLDVAGGQKALRFLLLGPL